MQTEAIKIEAGKFNSQYNCLCWMVFTSLKDKIHHMGYSLMYTCIRDSINTNAPCFMGKTSICYLLECIYHVLAPKRNQMAPGMSVPGLRAIINLLQLLYQLVHFTRNPVRHKTQEAPLLTRDAFLHTLVQSYSEDIGRPRATSMFPFPMTCTPEKQLQ